MGNSPLACQTACAATEGCDFFSYEWEEEPDNGINYHECYLKTAYTCDILIEDQYAPWSNDEDPAWYGTSGPAVCPEPEECIVTAEPEGANEVSGADDSSGGAAVIIIIVVVLLVAAGGVAYYVFGTKGSTV